MSERTFALLNRLTVYFINWFIMWLRGGFETGSYQRTSEILQTFVVPPSLNTEFLASL